MQVAPAGFAVAWLFATALESVFQVQVEPAACAVDLLFAFALSLQGFSAVFIAHYLAYRFLLASARYCSEHVRNTHS